MRSISSVVGLAATAVFSGGTIVSSIFIVSLRFLARSALLIVYSRGAPFGTVEPNLSEVRAYKNEKSSSGFSYFLSTEFQ